MGKSKKKPPQSQPETGSFKTPLHVRSTFQRRYLTSITQNVITFCTGPAGTGKTYISLYLALKALLNNQVQKIVVTRPGFTVGRDYGALPGSLDEKFLPYIIPIEETLYDIIGDSYAKYLLKNKQISALPLEYMRGITLKDSFVLCDEAQNTSPAQMKMLLTRVGENSRMVINGDLLQADIPLYPNGLADALQRLQGIPSIGFVEANHTDIVRHSIIQDILSRY